MRESETAHDGDGARPDADRQTRAPGADEASRHVLLVGSGDLNDETGRALEAAGAEVARLKEPTEGTLRTALEDSRLSKVAIVSRDDPFVLRMALIVRHVSSEVPMVATIFDPTMADQLGKQIEGCRVTSLADIVAPSLAGPCIDSGLTAVRTDGDRPVGLRESDEGVTEVPLPPVRRRRVASLARAVFQPYDKAAGLLFYGALGILTVQLIETFSAMIVLSQSFVDAFYGAAKTVVTVGPNEAIATGPGWFKVFISVTMLLSLVFAAAFTAGLVERVVGRRLTSLLGRRAVPRSDHVVVAGLGEVGLRLCLLLRRCGVGVVAIEEHPDSEIVGLAHELDLPVVIGRLADPSLLQRLSLERARALAAVTDNDLANIAVAVATRTVNEKLQVVLRAGDGEIANETRSLFAVGLVRDVHRIAAVELAAMALDWNADMVVCKDDEANLLFVDGSLKELSIDTVTQA